MKVKDDLTQEPLYANVSEFFVDQFNDPGAWRDSVTQLLDEATNVIIQVSGGPGALGLPGRAELLTEVPVSPHGVSRDSGVVGLWHLGFQPDAFLRGPSATCDVLENISRAIYGQNMNQTHKYPLEVVFNRFGDKEGAALKDFGVALSVGGAVTLACHSVVHAVLGSGVWAAAKEMLNEDLVANGGLVAALAERLHRCLILHVSYGQMADYREQVFNSIAAKRSAAARQGPNLLNLESALRSLVLGSRGVERKTDQQLLLDEIKNFNKREKAKDLNLHPNEIAGIKLLTRQSEKFKRLLSSIWGAAKVAQSAVPMRLLGAPWLAWDAVSPVPESNSVWFKICSPSPAKYEAFLQRLNGAFIERQRVHQAGGLLLLCMCFGRLLSGYLC